MSQLTYRPAYLPHLSLIDELKAIFRTTPLAIFIAAIKDRR